MRERPEGSGRWELRVSVGRDPLKAGKYIQRSRIFQGNKTQAKKALAAFETELDAKGGGAVAAIKFGSLLERWFETTEPTWSPSTGPRNRSAIDKHIKPALGDIPLRRMTAEDFDRFYAALRKAGLSENTILRIHSICSSALNAAISWEWIHKNPATLARTKPKQNKNFKSTRDLPTLDAVAELFEIAADYDPEWGRLLLSTLGIGARRGEMCGLQLKQVNGITGLVAIEWQVIQPNNQGPWSLVPVKRNSRRSLTVDPATLYALQSQIVFITERAQAFGVKLTPESFLWSDAIDCSMPWMPNRFTRRFMRLTEPWRNTRKAGDIATPDKPKRVRLKMRLHDLRHLNGTLLSDLGVDLATISNRLGHARHSTTADIYIERGSAPSDARAAALLGERFKLQTGATALPAVVDAESTTRDDKQQA